MRDESRLAREALLEARLEAEQREERNNGGGRNV
jgi:hypothetical protein